MKLLILSLAVFSSAAVYSQDIAAKDVPSVVVNTLKAKFSNATGLDWEKKGSAYEAEFDVKKVDHTALLDASGKLIRSKHEVAIKDLPATITSAVASQYKGFKIDEAEKIEEAGKVFYQLELDGKPRDQKVVLQADGTVAAGVVYW